MHSYEGDPTTFPPSIKLLDDGTDGPSWSLLNDACYEKLADRTAFLLNAVIASKVQNFLPPGSTLISPATTTLHLGTAAWDAYLQRWTALFQGAGAAWPYSVHDGRTWLNLLATSVPCVGALAGAAAGLVGVPAVFAVQDGTGTSIVVVSNVSLVSTSQPFLGVLAQASIIYVPTLGYVLVGVEQSGGSFVGHAAVSAAGAGVWTDLSSSLPFGWATGTNHVAGILAAIDVSGVSTNPVLIGMCGKTVGTDTSRILAFAGTTMTDVTPAFLTGKNLTGLAYNAVLKTWGILCCDNSNVYLYTTPDQVTWTLAHTFQGCGLSGGLATVGSIWAAQLTVVDFGSGTTDNDRVMLSPDGISWSTASYCMGQDSVSGVYQFPRLLSSGVQFLAFNNGAHNFSRQSGFMPSGAY